MGDNQSKESEQVSGDCAKLYCLIHEKELSIDKFRVLRCGHYFCEECIKVAFDQEIKTCPSCREKENRDLEHLDKPYNFKGKLLYQYPKDGKKQKLDIEKMIFLQMNRRATTIR